MSNNAIKKIDITQIQYTPMEGEVVQHSLDNCYYIWKDNTWNKVQVEGGGLELGLYDLNKQIIEQLDYSSAYCICNDERVCLNGDSYPYLDWRCDQLGLYLYINDSDIDAEKFISTIKV